MGRYLPLLSISARHDFFGDGVCRALDFTPSAETAARLDRADLLVRANADGMSLYCTAERLEVLRRYVNGEGGTWLLRFEVFAKATDFCQYTLPALNVPAMMWLLDSRNAQADEFGLRLHKEAYVAEGCAVQAGGGGVRRTPLMTIEMHLSAQDFAPDPQSAAGAPLHKRYYLRFEPRRTYWKYYLLGDIAKRNAAIVDLNGELEFERVEAPELGDRSALVYLSRVPLPMRDVPVQRLQLRGKDGAAEKVLIRRLPNADTGRLGKGTVEGKEVLVSEIFVNQ